GCCNCQIEAVCSAACTLQEPETCGADTNGGCNSTPEAFTNLTNNATVCGTGWADANTRDTDWYHLTVGASGKVQAHLQSTGSLDYTVFIASGATCASLAVNGSADSVGGVCHVALANHLTPGSV